MAYGTMSINIIKNHIIKFESLLRSKFM